MPGLAGVGPHRLEHAPRRDQYANTGGARLRDGSLHPLTQDEIFGDQRPIEVARDDLDVAREVVGEDQPEVDSTTYAVTSAICCSVS